MSRQNTSADRTGSGFTLIELLVVLIVIAIIISIIAPMLGRTRAIARSAMTSSMLTEIGKASQTFRTDTNRWPGYFSAREMGAPENETRGFSTMQNVMLDLAGGVFTGGTVPTMSVTVGPQSTTAVEVDLEAIGVPGKYDNTLYYTPQAKFFEKQDGVVGGQSASGTLADHQILPSLIDAFGNPMLAWVEDESAPTQITGTATVNNFVRMNAGNGLDEPARFYWAPNRVFTESTNLGRSGRDQTGTSNPYKFSLLAQGTPPGIDPLIPLMGLLGSPSSPVDLDPPSGSDILPAHGRSGMVLHSAGIDGYYFNGGARTVGDPAIALDYVRNFYIDPSSTSSPRQTDQNQKPTTIDVISGFDDLVTSAGS